VNARLVKDESNRVKQPGPATQCPFANGAVQVETLLTEAALLDPFPIYQRLRKERSVAYIPEQDFWLVTRYDDCEFILTHPELFSSREAVSSANAYRRSPEAIAILKKSKARPRARTLIMSDPPDHTYYRRILQRSLAPAQTIRALTPKMVAIIDELIDGFCARGSCEFVREFAYPLPMRVVASILDVPDEDIDMLKAWSDDFISVQAGNIPDDRVVSSARHTLEFEDFILCKLQDRREHPKDDFLGRLVSQPADERALTVPELMNMCLQVLVGGNESTTNFLGSAMLRVLTTPGLADRLRNNPSETAIVIEEILRTDSPLQGLFRIALDGYVFGDVTVPKGAKLMLCFGSANRDETYYGDGTFDPDRDNRETMHLAFGRGIHACAGQAFARREGSLAINKLLERLPRLRLAADKESVRQTLFSIRGMKELYLKFDQVRTAAARVEV
jgi:cytochrome P450